MNGNNRRASYDAIYFDSFGFKHILTNLYESKILKQILIEYEYTTRHSADNFVLDLLVYAKKVKVCLIIEISVFLMNIKR